MTDRAALLDALLADPSRASRVPRDEAVALLVEMARVERALELALVATPAAPVESEEDETPLTVEDVMRLTGLSRRSVWLKAHPTAGCTDWRPFVLRDGKKTLHFRPAFRRWLAGRA